MYNKLHLTRGYEGLGMAFLVFSYSCNLPCEEHIGVSTDPETLKPGSLSESQVG